MGGKRMAMAARKQSGVHIVWMMQMVGCGVELKSTLVVCGGCCAVVLLCCGDMMLLMLLLDGWRASTNFLLPTRVVVIRPSTLHMTRRRVSAPLERGPAILDATMVHRIQPT